MPELMIIKGAVSSYMAACRCLSQLADAIYAVRTVELSGEADSQPVTFAATSRTLTDKGWMGRLCG